MFSLMLSDLVDAESIDALREAVGDVAERSFFAAAEPLVDLPDPSADPDTWLTATVRFNEADARGVVACLLPHRLARELFDAFNGREPTDGEPAVDDLFDLVGEFANMVCGAWLTRTADGPAFVLSCPVVEASAPQVAFGARTGIQVSMSVNDLPLVVMVARA